MCERTSHVVWCPNHDEIGPKEILQWKLEI